MSSVRRVLVCCRVGALVTLVRLLAEGADKEESDDEEQAAAPALGLEPDELATDEDAAPGEDEGEAAEDGDLTGADQAPQTVGLPADAAKQQDAKGQGAAGPTETDTKAVPAQGREGARQKRVALLAPKTAWASQLTRCATPCGCTRLWV